MKTRFFTAFLFVLLSGVILAGENSNVRSSKQVGEVLKKGMNYPAEARSAQIEGSVSFALKLTEGDSVKVTVLASDNDLLAEHVEKRIESMQPRLARLLKEEGEEQVFRMKFELIQ